MIDPRNQGDQMTHISSWGCSKFVHIQQSVHRCIDADFMGVDIFGNPLCEHECDSVVECLSRSIGALDRSTA